MRKQLAFCSEQNESEDQDMRVRELTEKIESKQFRERILLREYGRFKVPHKSRVTPLNHPASSSAFTPRLKPDGRGNCCYVIIIAGKRINSAGHVTKVLTAQGSAC